MRTSLDIMALKKATTWRLKKSQTTNKVLRKVVSSSNQIE